MKPTLKLGRALTNLVTDPASWIERRVESVSFISERAVRRRVSIDFTVPKDIPAVTYGEQEVKLIPLALLRKRELTDFDIEDQSGQPLSVLTRSENTAVSRSMLRARARDVLGKAPPKSVDDLFEDLAGGSRLVGTRRLLQLRMPTGRERPTRQRLMADPLFRTLAEIFARSFLILFPDQAETAGRRIVKFEYDEAIANPRQSAFAERAGFRPNLVVFQAPSIGDASSYHFEVVAPPELEIAGAGIQVTNPDGTQVDYADKGLPHRSHAYARGVANGTPAIAWAAIRPRLAGLVWASLMATLFTAVVLSLGLWRLPHVERNLGVGSSLLLLIPGLLTAAIARPGEHAVATNMLTNLRALVLLSGTTAFLAAGALAGDIATDDLYWAWRGLVLFAWLIFLTLAIGTAIGRRSVP